jgi:PAS domain S-box-containing protein
MRVLYIGTASLEQSISDALSRVRGEHEVLTAATKEDLIRILELGNAYILLFDCDSCPVNLTLAQTLIYSRAFKTPVFALTSMSTDIPVDDLQTAGISGYLFREHIGQLPFVIGSIAENTQLEREMHEVYQALERTGDYYQTLLKNINDFVFLFDEKGDLVYLSPSADELTGFSRVEGQLLFEYIHPDDRRQFFYQFKKVLKKPDARVEVHFRIRHKSGHHIWIEGSVANLVKNEAIEAFMLSCRDVTERTEMEHALIRLNRLYASIRQINRAILSVEDERSLFKDLCYIATEFGNFRMAYISMTDPLTGKLKLVQSSGVAEPDVEPSMVVNNLEYAPLESVLQTGQCFVCNNVEEDMYGEYWKYVARQKGFRSFILLPVCRLGRVSGVFMLAAAGTDFFNAKEIELLEETADDISFKLDALKKEQMHMVQGAQTVHQHSRNMA